jgi:hypothetical protein
MTPTTDGATEAVRQAFGERIYGFRPCALFDERLDCIRVIARDVSVTEVRVDERLTVLESNINGKYVGFTIKGAKHFCQEQGLSLKGPVRLADLLDKIVKVSPDPIVAMAVNLIAKKIVEDERVDLVDLAHQSVLFQTA